jgi:hypothetical protein
VAGNINEGDDLWAEDLFLPEVREGDVIAFATGRQLQPLDGTSTTACGRRPARSRSPTA